MIELNKYIINRQNSTITYITNENKDLAKIFVKPFYKIDYFMNGNTEIFIGRYIKKIKGKDVKKRIKKEFECSYVMSMITGDKPILRINRLFFERTLFIKEIKKIPKTRNHLISENICVATKNNYIILNDRIYRVSKFKDLIKGDIMKPQKYRVAHFPIMARKQIMRLVVFFDFETVSLNDDGKQIPYLLSVHSFFDSPLGLSLTAKNFIFENKELLDNNQLVKDVFRMLFIRYINLLQFSSIIFIGFNNHKFDDQFLLKGLMELSLEENEFYFKNVLITQKIRNGRITSEKISYMLNRIKMDMYIKDLRSWIPDCSLAQACVDYEIEESKLDIDILVYNDMILREKKIVYYCSEEDFYSVFKSKVSALDKFKMKKIYYNQEKKLYNIYNLIKIYCEKDTASLKELYLKIKYNIELLSDDIHNLTGKKLPSSYFFDYISAPEYGGYIMKTWFNKISQRQLIWNDYELSRVIISTYFGGRVNYGLIGDYKAYNNNDIKGEICYYDVVSEYPLAMLGYYPDISKKNNFLIGFEINVSYYQEIFNEMYTKRAEYKRNRSLHLFDYFKPFNNFCAIFFVKLEMPENKNDLISFACAAKRLPEVSKLIYSHDFDYPLFMNTSQLRNFILTGYKITILPHKYNILFPYVSKIFAPFMDFLGEKKEEAKNAEQKTKAKLIKLFANSIAGKLAQRTDHTIGVVNSTESNCESVKYKENNFEQSRHYLAAFITANANWILYHVLYMLELHNIYNDIPQEKRGSQIYMDTDSICFDKNLANPEVNFKISQFLGSYDDEKCNWDISWGRKYAKANRMIVLARKSYLVLNDNEIITSKLKGIHTKEMPKFTLDVVLDILRGNPHTIEFDGLVKQNADIKITGNSNRTFFQEIMAVTLKKTLAAEKDFKEYEMLNEKILLNNYQAISSKLLKFVSA